MAALKPKTFGEILEQWRSMRGLDSMKAAFEELGGERALGVQYRQFVNIWKGVTEPTAAIYRSAFKKFDPVLRKELILAFHRSFLGDDADGVAVTDYLQRNLFLEAHPEKSIWTGLSQHYFSLEQLQLLKTHPEANRLWQMLLVKGATEKERCKAPPEIIAKLLDLEILTEEGGKLRVNARGYIIPNKHGNSGPKHLAAGTELLMQMPQLFCSMEEHASQDISYTIQVIDKADAPTLLANNRNLNYNARSYRKNKLTDDRAVYVQFNFARMIERDG